MVLGSRRAAHADLSIGSVSRRAVVRPIRLLGSQRFAIHGSFTSERWRALLQSVRSRSTLGDCASRLIGQLSKTRESGNGRGVSTKCQGEQEGVASEGV